MILFKKLDIHKDNFFTNEFYKLKDRRQDSVAKEKLYLTDL